MYVFIHVRNLIHNYVCRKYFTSYTCFIHILPSFLTLINWMKIVSRVQGFVVQRFTWNWNVSHLIPPFLNGMFPIESSFSLGFNGRFLCALPPNRQYLHLFGNLGDFSFQGLNHWKIDHQFSAGFTVPKKKAFFSDWELDKRKVGKLSVGT